MSGFVRPEIAAAARRWREALAGAGVVALGLWWAIGTGPLVNWVGWLMAALGGGLIAAGIQRGRFRQGRDGPGVVRVDEGQIAYFGPWDGGIAALSEITEVTLDRGRDPAVWRIRQPGRGDLEIPVTAEGAEALFDAFGALPFFDTRAMLAALHGVERYPVTIWEKPSLRLH
ncbi:hypothetical protein [Pseudooceanicola nanhaiensis]|jgi:hypothetical protein|uniref:Uncharacterized protein n=1 Tax=Pseudooceanicola nanhaiensis TaxID=375761 RepID=A0A917SWM0_9RHOB|nr:hypothetical protein [Pseudooceanicola nanhaiensis]GGL99537.1 hypothetical protein GCM10011534_21740 [Pseudooceanicola nanhaiensis]